MTRLVGSNGVYVDVPPGKVERLLGVGFTVVEQPRPEPEPAARPAQRRPRRRVSTAGEK